MSAGNVIEYFATLGKPEGSLRPKPIKSFYDETESFSPADLWLNAITEIAFVFKNIGEDIPDETWEYVRDFDIDAPVSFNGSDSGSPNVFLVVQRRRHNQRVDHITQIQVTPRGPLPPPGFSVVEKSVTGLKVNDSRNSHQGIPTVNGILIQRSQNRVSKLFFGDPIMDQIYIFTQKSRSDKQPEGYQFAEKSLNNSMFSSKTFLMYHCYPALGLCDLSYEAAALDRYPVQDLKGLPLPVTQLPIFAFPHGLHLLYDDSHNYPLPDIFTFVFTDANGKHLYVAGLRFYEILPQDIIADIIAQSYHLDWHEISAVETENNKNNPNPSSSKVVFTPKVICIISQLPYYRTMQKYLKQLYSLSLSHSQYKLPLEAFISSIVGQIPQPLPGGRPFFVSLDAGLVTENFHSMSPLRFHLPPREFFPLLDLDFTSPFRCLSVDHILAVFTLMLHESKLVFLCSSNALLTDFMEVMRALLFPCLWSFTFIPRLPDQFSAVLEAPGGFMVGLHEASNKSTSSSKSTSKSNSTAALMEMNEKDWVRSLQVGTYVVDLSKNSIVHCESSKKFPFRTLKPIKLDDILDTLPIYPRARLQDKLQAFQSRYQLGPEYQRGVLETYDLAFDFVDQVNENKTKLDSFPTNEVRDAFLVFMADILGDYWTFISPPKALTGYGFCTSASSFVSLDQEFRMEEYLQQAHEDVRPILRTLVHTQMFGVLLQTRAEELYHPLLFFEKAVIYLRESNLTTLPSRVDRYGNFILERYVTRLVKPLHLRLFSESDEMSAALINEWYEDDWWNSSGHYNRKELQTVPMEELELSNISKGPLILFGPTVADINTDGTMTADFYSELIRDGRSSRSSSVTNSSSHSRGVAGKNAEQVTGYGWPYLNRQQLQRVEMTAHERLKSLHKMRMTYANQTDDIGPHLLPRSLLDKYYSPNKQTQMESLPLGMQLVLDVISNAFTLLSLRIMVYARIAKPIHSTVQKENTLMISNRPNLDAAQALGLFALLQNAGVIHQIDLNIWRGLFVAFASHRMQGSTDEREGLFLRYSSCSLFEALIEENIHPDSISFAAYTHSVSPNPNGDFILSSLDDDETIVSPIEVSETISMKTLQDVASESMTAIQLHGIDSFQYLEELGLGFMADMTTLPPRPSRRSTDSLNQSIHSNSSFTSNVDGSNHGGVISVEKSYLKYKKEQTIRYFKAKQSIKRAIDKLYLKQNDRSLKILSSSISKASLSVVFPIPYNMNLLERLHLSPSPLSPSASFISLPIHMFTETYILDRLQQTQACKTITNGSSPSTPMITNDPISHLNFEEFSIDDKGVAYATSSPPPRPPPPPSNDAKRLSTGSNRSSLNLRMLSSPEAFGGSTTSGGSPQISGHKSLTKSPAASVSDADGESTSGKIEKIPRKPSFTNMLSRMMRGSSSKLPETPPDMKSKSGIIESKSDILPSVFDLVNPNSDYSTAAAAFDSVEPQFEIPVAIISNDTFSLSSLSSSIANTTTESSSSSKFLSLNSDNLSKLNEDLNASETKANQNLRLRRELTHVPGLTTTDAIDDFAQVFARNSSGDLPSLSNLGDQPSKNSWESVGVKNKTYATVAISHADDFTATRIKDAMRANQKMLLKDMTSDSLIGIYFEKPCVCGYVLAEEEILHDWNSKYKVEKRNHDAPIKKQNDEDLKSSTTNQASVTSSSSSNKSSVSCQICKSVYIPELSIGVYKIHRQSEENSTQHDRKVDSSDSVDKDVSDIIDCVASEKAAFLSPAELREEIEAEVDAHGKKVCDVLWLHEHRPDIYWNLIWYSVRLNVPTGLMVLDALTKDGVFSTEGTTTSSDRLNKSFSWIGCVTIAMREATIRTRIRRLLTHTRKNGREFSDISMNRISVTDVNRDSSFNVLNSDEIGIQAILPFLADGDVRAVESDLIGNLDGSSIGLRRVVRAVFPYVQKMVQIIQIDQDSNVNSNSHREEILSRTLYYALAAIVHALEHNSHLYLIDSNAKLNQSRSKDFDSVYKDTIRNVLTNEDLQELGETSATMLLRGIPEESIRSIRELFGHIL